MPDEQTKWNRVRERPRGEGKKPFVAKYSAASSQPLPSLPESNPYENEARRDRVIFLCALGLLALLTTGALLYFFLKK